MKMLGDNLQTKIKDSGLVSVKVIASGHQSEFAKWLGLETIANFSGSDSETASNINDCLNKAKQKDVKFIIANKQEGTYLADSLADRLNVKTIVFSNFPEKTQSPSGFDELLHQNVNAIITGGTEMIAGNLILSNICVKRAGRIILNIENLQIKAGDFVGIIGTNGAGKTTLLKFCCGLIKPNAGMIKFDGMDLANLSAWSKTNLRKHIGYIPQQAEYNPDLPFTLREVVAMGRTSIKPLLQKLGKEDYEIVDGWIDKLGLSENRNQTFRSLSGGEQQKALIARAMAQKPRILMLDEPCSNLDFNWKYQITDIIEQLYNDMNITVLMVSHDTSLLPACCRRAVLLHKGNLIADGDTD